MFRIIPTQLKVISKVEIETDLAESYNYKVQIKTSLAESCNCKVQKESFDFKSSKWNQRSWKLKNYKVEIETNLASLQLKTEAQFS